MTDDPTSIPAPMAGYASVRELYRMKDQLLVAVATLIRESEARLTEKIEEANRSHEQTHDVMRRTADARHQIIDDFLEGEALKAAAEKGRDEGRKGLAGQILTTARLVNEFKWLIATAILALTVALGGVSVSVR